MTQRLLTLFTALILGAVLFLLTTAYLPAGAAATFTVDSTVDAVDETPGNGTCATALGECTLRAAIMEANALAGADTIVVPAGTYTLTLAGPDEDGAATGDLDILEDVTISGAGRDLTVIDGGGLDRVVQIGADDGYPLTGRQGDDICGGPQTVDALLVDLAVVNGVTNLDGGGIYSGADTCLTVEGVRVADNVSGFGSSFRAGGGIAAEGFLTVTQSIVTGNSAVASAGGDGGGINAATGAIAIFDTSILSNTANSFGGGLNIQGLATQDLTATIVSSTVAHNRARFDGGGIRSQSPLRLAASSVVDNESTSSGVGGLWIRYGGSIESSTISGNRGGGVFLWASQTGFDFTVEETLFFDNRPGAALHFSAATEQLFIRRSAFISNALALEMDGGVPLVRNSTLSGNGAAIVRDGQFFPDDPDYNARVEYSTIYANGGDPAVDVRLGGITFFTTIVANDVANCDGTTLSAGYNIEDADTCNLVATGDMPNTDPLLDPLADNGGATPTHLPLGASPAVDGGSDTVCPSTDQRGVPRPIDGDGDGDARCDVGAVEAGEFVATDYLFLPIIRRE